MNSSPNICVNSNNGNKIVEMVYSLLEMLRMSSPKEMSTKLLLMSQSPQICREMRQYGCLPLLLQLIHEPMVDADGVLDREAMASHQALRERASQTFRNIIQNAVPKNRLEIRVLRLIDDLRSFVDFLRKNGGQLAEDFVDHPNSSVAYLLKVSFDEQHRHVITVLGGVYAIAEVIQYDYEYHRNARNNSCLTLRRYSLMTLINLTFGDSKTKSLLATIKPFMKALVHNLESPAEELRQVVASLLRNLSWKADYTTKQILREIGAVALLTQAALEANKESTLKSILSALWNLTAHCAPNKADFCKVNGALPFLISTLSYNSSSNSISIVENGGGILRNISSHIVVNEEYREILRKHNTIAILLDQLKSPSITVVSNACVTLWNLSARCPKDQCQLWESGAVPMLRNLTNSKHRMIAMGASATLKNLFSSPVAPNYIPISGNSCLNASNSCSIPSLKARKMKALKDDINCNLSETFDNIESPKISPTHESYPRRNSSSSSTAKPNVYLPGRMYTSFSGQLNPHRVSRSSSHDSIGSTHSEPVSQFRDVDHNLMGAQFIYPFSTQVLPQMYSTLQTNDSRVVDKNIDIGSDFDIFCGESNSQMNMSNTSAKSTSFTDAELDVDPEPTDYSQRYKERPIDDFIAPRSNKQEVVCSEDSVKVYKTEGTPLNFSLASSLSDLRECCLSAIDEEKQSPKNIDSKQVVVENNCFENKSKMIAKKPALPPKPRFCSSPTKQSIDDNTEDNKSDPKSVSFTDNQIKSSISINSIVSFDASNENLCEETPLMYSRSSSLDSLSDCEVKSDICQSSVVSEFSRRQSEAVTPTDLPDSPLGSPRPMSPKQMSNTEQSIDMCNKTIEVNENIDSDDIITEMSTVFEDKPTVFATEDTPAVFSLATSLSSLNEDISDLNINDDSDTKVADNEKSMKFMETSLEVDDIDVEVMSTSSEDEGEDQLLAECISSGMKNISNETTISRNSLPRTDTKNVVRSSSPSKPIPIAQPRMSINKSTPLLIRSAPDGQSSFDRARVSSQKRTAMSPISISTKGKDSNHTPVQHQSHESHDDEILQKCIASGMSSNHKSSKSKGSPKTPKTTPNESPNCSNAYSYDKKYLHDFNDDQTKRFFVEDTPIEMSRCHSSLSSLSFDSDDDLEEKKLLNEVISRGMSQKKTIKTNDNSKSLQKTNENQMNISCDGNEDTITYTVCHKSERLATNKKLTDSLMTNSGSCMSDLEGIKPPSLMDNCMFSSTESFSYRPVVANEAKNIVISDSADSQVLLDNVKPPSLMGELSMSQSCASITSDISEIAFDTESNEKIAEMAKNCTQIMQSLTYSADNSDSDRPQPPVAAKRCKANVNKPKNPSKEVEYEVSDIEVFEEVDREVEANTVSDVMLTLDDISPQLPLESPTICEGFVSDFDVETRPKRVEVESLYRHERRISPIGSEDLLVSDDKTSLTSDDSDPESRLTYNVDPMMSMVSKRGPRIVRPVVRKNKPLKEDFVYPQPPVPRFINSSSTAITVKNKYTAKQTRTSALRASRSRSEETHYDGHNQAVHSRDKSNERFERNPFSTQRLNENRFIDYMSETKSNQTFNSFNNSSKLQKSSKFSENSKNKEKSGFVSHMRSKLTSSLSSHTLGSSNASLSSNSSNGMTPSCASFSKRLEVQSRIASLWKRSKSLGNDKNNRSEKSDLSRSISARRSFGKSTKCEQNSNLLRSSTFEKLPQSADEAMSVEPPTHRTIGDKYFNNNYIEKTKSNQKKCQQNDKTNGNIRYLPPKLPLKSSKRKTHNNSVNNNVFNDEITATATVRPSALLGGTGRSSSKSRRTCLVTAV